MRVAMYPTHTNCFKLTSPSNRLVPDIEFELIYLQEYIELSLEKGELWFRLSMMLEGNRIHYESHVYTSVHVFF